MQRTRPTTLHPMQSDYRAHLGRLFIAFHTLKSQINITGQQFASKNRKWSKVCCVSVSRVGDPACPSFQITSLITLRT